MMAGKQKLKRDAPNKSSLSSGWLGHSRLMRRFQHIFCAMGLLSFLFAGCGKQAAPKSKPTTQTTPPREIYYSQLDITERFDDHLHLKSADWISTAPLNKSHPNGKGLPPANASVDEVYKAAEKLSQIRETISIPSDGVYCPVCHIANTQLAKLRTPCPKCRRPLLKFGWD
jgi:hypothetical protein